ncbi:MAG: SulP family inorganic anion transporter [Elusimicrobiota bacterium]|nr:MAG: SulP family inorganic anion transporter [Elusimicrobiota bacterium]
MKTTVDSLKTDALAGVVVFLVAVPLCLGIALASGAPLFSGIITGIIGGALVGFLSKSHISVAGPAAGLSAIVYAAIKDLGSFEVFLLAVVLAGAIQLVLGFARAGAFSSYLPTNVIEGMLAAIGVIIVIKQLPYAAGWENGRVDPGALLITAVSLGILIAWTQVEALKRIKAVPGALVAVVAGVLIDAALRAAGSEWALAANQLVALPVPASAAEFLQLLTRPDFSKIGDASVWKMAATIAAVASIETLLCIEAADKLDPLKRYTDTNAELRAQGVGNMVAGLLGGLPMTSVIVRTTANVSAGGRTKAATITHGLLLLVSVATIPTLLNRIPLATLASVLLMTGWKLAGPTVFRHMWAAGKSQFIPFAVTVVAVVATDLLMGVGIGLATALVFILWGNMKHAYHFSKEAHHEGETIKLELAQEVSFLNKAAIKRVLNDLPPRTRLVVDASKTSYVDYDVLELLREFLRTGSKDKQVKVQLVGFKKAYKVEDAVEVGAAH